MGPGSLVCDLTPDEVHAVHAGPDCSWNMPRQGRERHLPVFMVFWKIFRALAKAPWMGPACVVRRCSAARSASHLLRRMSRVARGPQPTSHRVQCRAVVTSPPHVTLLTFVDHRPFWCCRFSSSLAPLASPSRLRWFLCNLFPGAWRAVTVDRNYGTMMAGIRFNKKKRNARSSKR